MKKIWMAVLLSCLLTPAYADNPNQQNLDQYELYQQMEAVQVYTEDKINEIMNRKLDTLSPEQRRLDTGQLDKRAEDEIEQSVQRQFIQSWAGHMNQCYERNAARLCAYRDMYFHQLYEPGLRRLGHQFLPLHAQTRAWMRQNPRLSEQAEDEISKVIRLINTW